MSTFVDEPVQRGVSGHVHRVTAAVRTSVEEKCRRQFDEFVPVDAVAKRSGEQAAGVEFYVKVRLSSGALNADNTDWLKPPQFALIALVEVGGVSSGRVRLRGIRFGIGADTAATVFDVHVHAGACRAAAAVKEEAWRECVRLQGGDQSVKWTSFEPVEAVCAREQAVYLGEMTEFIAYYVKVCVRRDLFIMLAIHEHAAAGAPVLLKGMKLDVGDEAAAIFDPEIGPSVTAEVVAVALAVRAEVERVLAASNATSNEMKDRLMQRDETGAPHFFHYVPVEAVKQIEPVRSQNGETARPKKSRIAMYIKVRVAPESVAVYPGKLSVAHPAKYLLLTIFEDLETVQGCKRLTLHETPCELEVHQSVSKYAYAGRTAPILQDAFSEALAAVLDSEPLDPVRFLGEHILKNRPNVWSPRRSSGEYGRK